MGTHRPTPALASALGLLLLASATASAQTPLVLDADIPAGTARYFAVPFTVPEGTREIEVRHDDGSATNILDWGLADPTRFRGWGGGNVEPAVVADVAASRSYLPGAIPAGQWLLLIGQAKVVDAPAHYHAEIFLRTTPTLTAMPERRAYADAPALSTGPRWYAGDFHVHSRESGDATPTLDEVAVFARSRGLDFVELSEHNTVSQLELLGAAQAAHRDLLFVPGIEVTTYSGHANAIGATRWVDFRVGSADPAVTIHDITDAVAAQNAIFSINHPMLNLGDVCIGCAWTLAEAPGTVRAIEIENGAYSVVGSLFYPQVIRFWERYLARGEHVTPLGGSDDHRAGTDHGSLSSPIGGPTTMVYATELSVPAILAGVRAGRTVVKLDGPGDPMVDLRAGDDALLGDTVRARHATLRATVTGGTGSSLRFVHNGSALDPVAVTGDPFTTTLDVDAPPGAADDRWRCELAVNEQPRVVTGHVWVAATGEPVVEDAGIDAGADAGHDAGVAATTTAGGCGCRTAPTSPGGVMGLLLAAVMGLRARRRSKVGEAPRSLRRTGDDSNGRDEV